MSRCSDLHGAVTVQMLVIFVREQDGLVLHMLMEPGLRSQIPLLR